MEQFDRFIKNIEKGILVVFLICMLILGLLQIVSRFIIQRPLTWSEALLTYMFVWSSFIGASLAVAEKAHFGVEILVERFPLAIQRKIEWLVSVCVLGFALLILYKGSYLAWANREQLMPALPYSMSWPYLILPLSSFFIAVHALTDVYRLSTGKEV